MKASELIKAVDAQRSALIQFGYIKPDEDPDVVLDVPFDAQLYRTGANAERAGFSSIDGTITIRFELDYDPEQGSPDVVTCGCGAVFPTEMQCWLHER